jgi:prefoldin subunit 5
MHIHVHDLASEHIDKLHKAKEQLKQSIDEISREIDRTKQDDLGFMNQAKKFAAGLAMHYVGLNTMVGETYKHMAQKDFDNAHEYIDDLKRTQDSARGAIAKIDQILANIEAIDRDHSALEDRLQAWLNQAKDLLS